jgi:hypothetical protein
MNNPNNFRNMDHQAFPDAPGSTPDQPNPEYGRNASSDTTDLGSDDDNLDDGSGSTATPD